MVNISKREPFVLALTTGTIKYDKSLILPKPQHFAPSLRRPPIFRFCFRCRLVLLTPLAMRASLILTLALGAIAASATTIFPRAYPKCALDCLSHANFHGCGTTDYSCLCTNHQFLDETSQCIYNECTNPADLAQAIQAAAEACKAAGYPISSTYTPTQSRSNTAGPSSTGSFNATVTPTGSTTTHSSSSPAPTTSHNAATRASYSGVAALFGAAVLGALAF
jgi:hypothetical protein